MGSKRGQRHLTPEERELWMHVTRQDQRLASAKARKQRKAAASPKPEAAIESVLPPNPPQNKEAQAAKPALQQPGKKSVTPAPAVFDARLDRRIRRGQKAIDARLDLHGLRQQDAYMALRGFLARAQAMGHRQVLVITGKGAKSDETSTDFWQSGQRGVLRRLVPIWLAEPDFRLLVVTHKEAAPHHGGSGALYVVIRRAKV